MTKKRGLIFAGILLIALSLFSLAAIPIMMIGPLIDFPCEAGFFSWNATPDSRIAYCISYWPRAGGGGGIYAEGSSDQNRVVLDPQKMWSRELDLERQQQTLVVNGKSLLQGETYEEFRWWPSWNPWLFYTARMTVIFGDPRDVPSLRGTSVIYVTGSMREGWWLNPVGPIMLVVGIWLLVKGVRARWTSRPTT